MCGTKILYDYLIHAFCIKFTFIGVMNLKSKPSAKQQQYSMQGRRYEACNQV